MKSKDGSTQTFRVFCKTDGIWIELVESKKPLSKSKFDLLPRLMWAVVHYYIGQGRSKDLWYHLGMMLSAVEDHLPRIPPEDDFTAKTDN